MKSICSSARLARPEQARNAGLHIRSIFGAAAIVALTAFFTSAQAQYLGYRPYGGYGPGYDRGYHHSRSFAGYFAPGQLGPQFDAGYYEVTILPTTSYELPPYEEPGFNGGGDAVSYCLARFRSYDPASGLYLGYDGYPHPCP